LAKVTPKGDLSWWVKWISSFILTLAIASRAFGFTSWDLWLSFIGILGWAYVGYLWHDRALMFVNTVASVVLMLGIVRLFA